MTKKKGGWKTFDNMDDFLEAVDAQRETGVTECDSEPEVAKISLDDFVIKDKVSAFARSYEPCDEFDPRAERFGDAELRAYFKAYVTGIGDPLSRYIEDLKLSNFVMVTSVATNKPSIFARLKI